MRKYLFPSATLLILFFIALLENSCTKKVGKAPVTAPVPVNVCDSATYTLKIKKLIETNCAIPGCHSSGFPSGDFTTYDGLKTRVDAGVFKTRVFDSTGNPMPPASNGGMLSSDKLQIIKCWLDKGAKND